MLDNEGVSKAVTDRAMYVRLKVAYEDGHRVLTSAAILAEILRGTSRDAEIHRVLAALPWIGNRSDRTAGSQLIGAAGMSAQQAVDAMVAATAIEQVEHAEVADRSASVLIVTSDLPDLTKLVARRPGVAVVHVSKLGQPSGR